MIGKKYTGFYNKNGSCQKSLVFGCYPEQIEGYEEAINSEELYVAHHLAECRFTEEELRKMNHYDIVNPEELIWIPKSLHDSNTYIHKGCRLRALNNTGKHRSKETKDKMRKSQIGKTMKEESKNKLSEMNLKTDLGIKYKEHYKIRICENRALYAKERRYFKKHGKCSWEN